jgi:hypothetical protein
MDRLRPPPSSGSHGGYARSFLATLLLILSVVGAATSTLDPFGIHRWIEVPGINAHKPATHARVRMFKAYEVERVKPETVILGSSRSHVGFSCRHPALARLPGPCYNLAFDGATTREMFEYLVHANEIRPLRTVLLGLDTYHLSDATSLTRPGFDAAVLLSARHRRWQRAVEGDLRLAISVDALASSLDMLRHQSDGEPEWFLADGQRSGELFFRRPGEEFAQAGPRAYFDAIDRLEVGFQTPTRSPSVSRGEPSRPDPAESSLAYVGRIASFCRERGIELRIAITPSHVHQLEISALLGAGAALETGKRALVRLLAREAGGRPGNAVPVWDFSGYSSITTEPLPRLGSREEMKYYWDSSHFKSGVGDLVLERVFATGPVADAVPPDFGVLLDADTLEAALSSQRARQASHRDSAADDLAALRRLVESAQRAELP